MKINRCEIGHHLWGIGDAKAPEGLPRDVRPFKCDRCGVIQLMSWCTSGKLNSYVMRDKRCESKPKIKICK